jgi:cyclic pyranopterin monophosphate synthase
MPKLSHYGRKGNVRMVDVSAKPETTRIARARGFIAIAPGALRLVRQLKNPKGNPLEIARIAGIAAAKRTSELIPLCHPLLLTHIDLKAELRPKGVEIRAEVRTNGPTGVEMEALTAVAVAALTIYDMCKAADRSMKIGEIYLEEKIGGRSGHYVRRAGKTKKNNSGR